MNKKSQDRTIIEQNSNDGHINFVSKRAGIGWIMVIYFLSGTCSLIDEVVWVRLLKLTLGNTVYASSIVVSTFMGGLALGALIMSRYSDGVRRRLSLYALLETLVTISALALPFVLKAADHIYVWFYRSYHPSKTQLLIVQIVVSTTILLVPSMLMGSTLPLLGRFVTAFEKEAGHLVGRLYALNTLGAATGCFLAGFILIRTFGVMDTLYIAAVLNLIVAFGGWYLSRLPDIIKGEAAENTAAPAYNTLPAKESGGKFYILIVAFFISGLISIGYELLWMRSIIHLLSGFTYVFSSVLTIYLLGNVIGVTIGSGLVKTLKMPAIGFAITLFLLGLCGIFYLPAMILWSSKLMPLIDREVAIASRTIPFSTFMIKPLIQSAFLFSVPSVIMGIGFPIALQAWTNHVHKVGRSTGTAYAANTIGAVIGGIIVGFVLIPLGGLQFSITMLGLTGIWIAVLMCILFVRPSQKLTRFGLITTAGVFTIIALVIMPSDMFETVVARNPELLKQLELIEIKEGTTTTVSLLKDTEEDTLYLYTSGLRVAGDTYFWRSDQKMLGHFGILLNKDAEKALSVGFGSGESTACLALHDLERTDCAEIAPEIVELSLKYFRHINLGDRLNEEVNIIFMDAKNYIHLTDIKYDAIINDSIHPWLFADNASLYTKEYYESTLDHLEDNGLFLSWIPIHNTEPTIVLNSIIGTMMDVFPNVTIWFMTPSPAMYYLVVGSEKPQYFSPKYIDDELEKEGVRESLSLININNSLDLMSCYIGDKVDLQQHITSYELNSDYSPFIEFMTSNIPGGYSMFTQFIRDVRSDSVYRHIDWTGFSEEQKQNWIVQFEKLYEASTYLLMTNGTGSIQEKIEYCMRGLSIIPDNPALLDVIYRNEQYLFSQSSKHLEANMPEIALATGENLLKISSQSALGFTIKSASLLNIGDIQQAYEAAQRAVNYGPDIPDTHMQMGLVLMATSRYEQAISEFQETLRLAQDDYYFVSKKEIQLLNALANTYSLFGDITQAIEASTKALELAKSSGRDKIADDIQKRIDTLRTSNDN